MPVVTTIETCVTADPLIEPNLIANFLAHSTASKLRNPSCNGPSRKSPRLNEHNTLSGRQIVQDRRRHKHGLARARRGSDNHRAAARSSYDISQHSGDRQFSGQ